MANNRFVRGSGCYKCEDCGKMTRNTTGSISLRLCARCEDKAGDENAVSDGHMTQAEFDAKWGEAEEPKPKLFVCSAPDGLLIQVEGHSVTVSPDLARAFAESILRQLALQPK